MKVFEFKSKAHFCYCGSSNFRAYCFQLARGFIVRIECENGHLQAVTETQIEPHLEPAKLDKLISRIKKQWENRDFSKRDYTVLLRREK
jgi:hypothetical protein